MSAHEDLLIRLLREFLADGGAVPIMPQTRFDALGLDSLTSLRFARKAQDALGVEIDLEWLFDHPTIADLACFLEARADAGAFPSRADA